MKTKALRYQLRKYRIPAKRAQVSDAELDERVAIIVEKYPNAGLDKTNWRGLLVLYYLCFTRRFIRSQDDVRSL